MASRWSAAQVRDAAPLFAALGDPTRLGVVLRLSSSGAGFITHLSRRAKVSRQAITKHLQVLSEARLVRGVRRGRQHVWKLEPQRLADARDYLDRVDADWDAALLRLKALVEQG